MATGKPTSWWTTLPGVLTALAALVTAGTGLMLGLHQVGLIGASTPQSPSRTVSQEDTSTAYAGAGSTSGPLASPAPAGQFSARLPYKQRFRVGDLAYEILSATITTEADNKLALSLSMRMLNYGDYDANFWDASFRVIVGQDTHPATGNLNELVPGDSTKVGSVLFVIPDNTRAAVLKIKYPGGERQIPFEVLRS